jgi:hypothetical protein
VSPSIAANAQDTRRYLFSFLNYLSIAANAQDTQVFPSNYLSIAANAHDTHRPLCYNGLLSVCCCEYLLSLGPSIHFIYLYEAFSRKMFNLYTVLKSAK